jgi:ribose transport system permease protein
LTGKNNGRKIIMTAKRAREFLVREKVLVMLIVIVICMSFASRYFLNISNILNIFMDVSIYGIIGCGMTIALICGTFDLSVGSVLALSGMLVVVLEPALGIVFAVLLSVLAAFIVGLINALLITRAEMNPFVVTLGAMTFVRGIVLKISEGKTILSKSEFFNNFGISRVFGIPSIVILFFLLLVITHLVLNNTRFGRSIFAIGSNEEVAKASGIYVRINKGAVFVICSVLAGVCGIVLTAKQGAAAPLYGSDAPITIISAVVIGGTSMAGGQGGVLRTLLGLLLVYIVANALNIFAIPSYIQTIVKGILVIGVVTFDGYYRKKEEMSSRGLQ